MLNDAELEWNVYNLGEHDLESHPEELFFVFAQNHQRSLEYCFPAIYQEVVPEAMQDLAMVAICLRLQNLGEQGDEIGT